MPAPAAFFFKIGGAHLHAHAARNFAHRRQQRQRALAVAHRLIGNANDLGLEKLVGQLRQRRQVQIGKQHQAFAEENVLLLDGLLDLDHHLGLAPGIAGVAHNLRAGILIFGVVEARLRAGLGLHQHLVAGLGQRLHAGRSHANARFVVLDLFGNADDHRCGSFIQAMRDSMSSRGRPAISEKSSRRNRFRWGRAVVRRDGSSLASNCTESYGAEVASNVCKLRDKTCPMSTRNVIKMRCISARKLPTASPSQ